MCVNVPFWFSATVIILGHVLIAFFFPPSVLSVPLCFYRFSWLWKQVFSFWISLWVP